ncbi:hypothetical protein ACFL27_21600, partial [candidate division CSSED10-310 bacterium]
IILVLRQPLEALAPGNELPGERLSRSAALRHSGGSGDSPFSQIKSLQITCVYPTPFSPIFLRILHFLLDRWEYYGIFCIYGYD